MWLLERDTNLKKRIKCYLGYCQVWSPYSSDLASLYRRARGLELLSVLFIWYPHHGSQLSRSYNGNLLLCLLCFIDNLCGFVDKMRIKGMRAWQPDSIPVWINYDNKVFFLNILTRIFELMLTNFISLKFPFYTSDTVIYLNYNLNTVQVT